MRFSLKLKVLPNVYGNKMPINYSYELSAWIYHVISKGNAAYASWLHNNGFEEKHRNFKLFVFSRLFSQRLITKEDRLFLTASNATFYLSFLPERSTEEFIKGVFASQELTLGDILSRVHFRVEKVEMIPPPVFTESTEFRTLSPVVVSRRDEENRIKYVSPEDPEYGKMLFNNLCEKYHAYYGREFLGNKDFSFELLSLYKSKLIKIKAYTKEETRVKGYEFAFRLNADHELLHIMYEAGIGEKNSTGFGMVTV